MIIPHPGLSSPPSAALMQGEYLISPVMVWANGDTGVWSEIFAPPLELFRTIGVAAAIAVSIPRLGGLEDANLFRVYTQGEQFLAEELAASASWLSRFISDLASLRNLTRDWDSYGAEPPNEIAIGLGHQVLRVLYEGNFPPISLAPSREEGITFSFFQGKKWAALECYNTGEVVAVTSDGSGNPQVWAVDADDKGLRAAVETIEVFLRRQERDDFQH